MNRSIQTAMTAAGLGLSAIALMPAAAPGSNQLLPHAAPAYRTSIQAGDARPGAGRWAIGYHGTCCEGNLAASGDNTYVLLPELTAGNDILRSTDDGRSWTKQYPAADVSAPFGIEGDLVAWGDDLIYFGTELAIAPVAHSDDGGGNFTLVQAPVIPAVNDQAWAYLGPLEGICPAPLPQSEPYVLAGWFRIGAEIIFSCDGGLTWPLHAPLAGNGAALGHVSCQGSATAAKDAGDTRVPHEKFRSMKAGRHGTWGTDGQFYWTDLSGSTGELYVCRSADFGQTWSGNYHPVADGPSSHFSVTHAVFDEKGTLYVLHADRLYVSFDQGRSFRFAHVLPYYGNAGRSDPGADQYFAVHEGRIHLALIESHGEEGTDGRIWYLRGRDLDTDAPRWHAEPVDITAPVRLDFMQIVVNGRGVPTLSYTTPTVSDPREVTTASLQSTLPYASLQASTTSGAAPLTVEFDAAASSDLDAEPLRHDFDFGDGTTVPAASTAQQSHVYATPGTYRARLTVTNPRGDSAETQMEIVVGGSKAVDARFGGALQTMMLGTLLAMAGIRGFLSRQRRDRRR